MTAHERVNRRALAALLVSVLLLQFGALLAYLYWWRGDTKTTAGPQEERLRAVGAIVAGLETIKAARERALQDRRGYEEENCPALERLKTAQPPDPTFPAKLAAVGQHCPDRANKLEKYLGSVQGLLGSVGEVETIDRQVAALKPWVLDGGGGAPSPPPVRPADGPSWYALLLAAVISVAVSVAVSAALAMFFAERNSAGAQRSAVVLANGFSTVNESLRQVHDALSEWARSALANAASESRAGRDGKGEHAGTAERAAHTPHPLAAEVRQGFNDLQGVLRAIGERLATPKQQPAPPPAASVRQSAAPSSAPPETPSPSPAPPSPSSSPTAREPHRPTPEAMPVEVYKQRFEATAGVSAAYTKGFLEANADGKLLVLRDERANLHYLIPKDERLQTPSFFNQDYATYYEGDVDLKPGLILILKPATVSPAGALWRLESRGRLTTGKQS